MLCRFHDRCQLGVAFQLLGDLWYGLDRPEHGRKPEDNAVVGALMLGMLLGMLAGIVALLTGYGVWVGLFMYSAVGSVCVIMVPAARKLVHRAKADQGDKAGVTH